MARRFLLAGSSGLRKHRSGLPYSHDPPQQRPRPKEWNAEHSDGGCGVEPREPISAVDDVNAVQLNLDIHLSRRTTESLVCSKIATPSGSRVEYEIRSGVSCSSGPSGTSARQSTPARMYRPASCSTQTPARASLELMSCVFGLYKNPGRLHRSFRWRTRRAAGTSIRLLCRGHGERRSRSQLLSRSPASARVKVADAMGIGIVLIFWGVVGLIGAAVGSAIRPRIASHFIQGTGKDCRQLILAIGLFPFVCLGWAATGPRCTGSALPKPRRA